MEFNYVILDVFTETPLAGNPLAVVQKADGLTHTEMQAIAAEFNLSETVFMCRPDKENHTAHLRIFTPKTELPFAGHPTVGAAVLLGINLHITAARFEEEVGVVTTVIERVSRQLGRARFSLPKLPEKIDAELDTAAMAAALGIEADEIGCGAYQPCIYSAGNAFHLVPVRDADVLKRAKLNRGGWDVAFPVPRNSVYVFTETPDERNNDFGARMFSPGMGIGEDPATGSALASLAGLLAEGAHEDGVRRFNIRQGVEMGRPSLMTLELQTQGGVLSHAVIGGSAVIVAQGVLQI